jgi:hypothetical protein
MNVRALRRWLAEPRTALVIAVADGVRAHVAALRSKGIEFYGYALLPGEFAEIHYLSAVTNGEADIKVTPNERLYRYHRYCVDEWANWHNDEFAAANKLIDEANRHFASLHVKEGGSLWMDEFEVAHAEALLDAIVCGLDVARHSGVFGTTAPFLAVWISDSDHFIIFESVQRLNVPQVVEEFLVEFRT